MASKVLPSVTVDLTNNPPAAHKCGIAWEHQQKYGYLKKRIAGGAGHTVAVLPDGSVVGCGSNVFMQLDMIDTWKNIIEVSCGYSATFALDVDHKVHATGYMTWEEEEGIPDTFEKMLANCSGTAPRSWEKKVISLSSSLSSEFHIAALREDGRVYAFGYKCQYGQCDVDGWCDMSQVIAHLNATIGVRRDGTVVCCGRCDEFEEITQWTNIERIYECKHGTIVGIKYDGTVVCHSEQGFDLSAWRDIIDVSASNRGVVGITGAGHLYFAGEYRDDLIQNGLDGYLDIQCDTVGPIYAIAEDHVYIYMAYGDQEQRIDTPLLFVNTGVVQTMLVARNGSVVTLVPDDYDCGQGDTDDWNLLPISERKSMPIEAPTNQGENSSDVKKEGGCYIATCVYGSYDCPEVWTLRRFRDDQLASRAIGRLFIRTYYATSPTLVRWFGKADWFRSLWRSFLNRWVHRLNANGVENTPYEDVDW